MAVLEPTVPPCSYFSWPCVTVEPSLGNGGGTANGLEGRTAACTQIYSSRTQAAVWGALSWWIGSVCFYRFRDSGRKTKLAQKTKWKVKEATFRIVLEPPKDLYESWAY